ncbi:MAG: oligosaccharide flippase family protein [Bacteroidota bacterium]
MLKDKIKNVLFTKNTLGSIIWFSVLGFLRPAIKIFLLPLYLVYLTPEDYGILALVTIFAGIVVILGNMRLDGAVRVFYFDYESESDRMWNYLSQIFTTILIMGLVLFGVMIVIGPTVMDWAFSSEEVSFFPYGIIALASAILSSYTTIYYIYLKNEVRLREYFVYSISYLVVSIGLQFYLIVFEQMGVLGVLYGGLIPSILLILIIGIRNSRLFNFKLDFSTIKPSLKFALPLVPFSLLFKFENQLDRLVLERYLNLETVGLYALLVALVGMVSILLTAVENGVRPFLYRSLKAGGQQAIIHINTYFNLFILVGLLALSGIIMVGSNLDLITDNHKYLSIRQFFVLAALAAIPLLLVRYFSIILVYYKKSKELTIVTIIKTVVMLALMIYIVPDYGIPGAIIAVAVSYFLNGIIFYILMDKFEAPAIRFTTAILSIALFVLCVLLTNYFIGSMSLMGVIQFVLTGIVLLPLIIPIIKQVANHALVSATG